MRVLVVEDDPLVAEGIRQGLSHINMTVDHVTTGEQAELSLAEEAFDLAIVDLGLPRMDGLTLIRRLRQRGLGLPLLILTARDTLTDCVDGLDVGADDYMTKPFRLPELIARVRALVRRSHSLSSAVLAWGGLQLDTARHTALLLGAPLDLPGREWSILEALLLQAPNVVSKDRLIQSIGGWEGDLTPNAIEVYISRLRTKLAPGNLQIRTVRGIGYRLDEPALG
ncbi:response regulator transcription factor [Oryzomicrobium sp.]|uniref:response regulator n=1 Tax=Oryzomicrobium sp. TaxID=1911578 RepID=UPI0025FF9840|nr:response regulator transcription factor [Oryzomicrobium sp.]MCE1244530.1 response regulator transcription factor [Oryzomicrobium sp.]